MTTDGKKIFVGHVAALSAYLIFGFNIIMTKELTNAHIFTPLSLYTLRAFGAGALFWLLSLFTKKETVARRDFLQILFASLLGYFGTQITFLVGINYATPLDCAIISTFQPVMTMLVAAYVLKEPITLKKAGGVGISLVGIIVLIMSSAASMADPSRLTTPFGLVMLIANSLCFAAYLGIFKPLIQRYSVVTFMKWIFFFSFVMSVPFSVGDIMAVDFASVPLACLGQLGYLIFFATFVAYFLIPVGQKVLRPTIVGLYSYVQPVIASALGIYLGMDRLSAEKVIAVTAVVTGVVLVNRSKRRDTDGLSAQKQPLRILVGFMKDGNMPLIRRHRLYYIPLCDSNGNPVRMDVATHVDYVLLHTEHAEIRWLFKVTEAPFRITGQDVRAMHFLTRGMPETQYMAYRLSDGGVTIDGFDHNALPIADSCFKPYFITPQSNGTA